MSRTFLLESINYPQISRTAGWKSDLYYILNLICSIFLIIGRHSSSQGRDRKRTRDDFGPQGSVIPTSRQDFSSRDRFESLLQKRSRGSWGGRAEWDNEPGQILDRQLSERQPTDRQITERILDRQLSDRIPERQIGERERDLRDIDWDRGLNGIANMRSRGGGTGRDEQLYFGAGMSNNHAGGGLSASSSSSSGFHSNSGRDRNNGGGGEGDYEHSGSSSGHRWSSSLSRDG